MSGSRIRVVIVDDHEVVRYGLVALLEAQPDIMVVGQAGTAGEAVAAVARTHPDVVLMDVRLPDRSGIEACREITSKWPGVPVIMLTSYVDEDLVARAIEAGASGYLLKRVEAGELVAGIRNVVAGRATLDAAAAAAVLGRLRHTETALAEQAFRNLTEREIDVLILLSQGDTNAEIAARLSVSEKTVANHISSLFAKMHVSNRVEAAAFAIRHGIDRLRPDTGQP